MVISHSNQFIFLRIPKNASTSVATYLVQNYCDGKDDAYTGIGDSNIRTKNISQDIIAKYRYQYRFIHLPLQNIVDEGIVSREKIDTMKVFGIIRHPLERQLSLYFFRMRQNKSGISPHDFQTVMSEGYHRDDASNSTLQTDHTMLDNNQKSIFWLYDDLLSDMARHLNKPIDLKTYKSQFTPDKNDLISEYYNKKTENAVLNYFEADMIEYERLKNENRSRADH